MDTQDIAVLRLELDKQRQLNTNLAQSTIEAYNERDGERLRANENQRMMECLRQLLFQVLVWRGLDGDGISEPLRSQIEREVKE